MDIQEIEARLIAGVTAAGLAPISPHDFYQLGPASFHAILRSMGPDYKHLCERWVQIKYRVICGIREWDSMDEEMKELDYAENLWPHLWLPPDMVNAFCEYFRVASQAFDEVIRLG